MCLHHPIGLFPGGMSNMIPSDWTHSRRSVEYDAAKRKSMESYYLVHSQASNHR